MHNMANCVLWVSFKENTTLLPYSYAYLEWMIQLNLMHIEKRYKQWWNSLYNSNLSNKIQNHLCLQHGNQTSPFPRSQKNKSQTITWALCTFLWGSPLSLLTVCSDLNHDFSFEKSFLATWQCVCAFISVLWIRYHEPWDTHSRHPWPLTMGLDVRLHSDKRQPISGKNFEN